MIKKKLVAAFLCLGMVGAMFTGCGSSDDSSSTASSGGKLKELPEYKGLEVYESVVEVTDDAIQEQIDQAAEDNATMKEKKGKIKSGDTVNIDYTGKVDGEEFDGGSATGYDLEIGSGTFIDGFEDQLIGHKKGQEFTIEVTFPETYTVNEDLAGKDATFDIVINSVSEEVIPTVDDAFVQEYFGYTECTTVDEFKDYIADRLRLNQIINAVWSDYLESVEVEEYDQDDLEEMQSQISSYMEYQIYYSTGYTIDDYLEAVSMTEDDWNEQILESAQSSTKEKMVITAIAEKEGWTISDDDYNTQAAIYATQQTVDSVEELESIYGKDEIEYSILSNKVFKLISDEATVVADPETTEEETEATDTDSTEEDTTAEETEAE